jgi:ATP-dependent Clp protease ATP-binding subunit ClpA
MIRRLDVTRRSGQAEQLADKFRNRIIGQPKAVDALIRVLEKQRSGFYDTSRPIASMLFLGPTGVGKTGCVEAFVEGLYGDAKHMLKVDCAEFQHGHEIARLLGSPPGYLGHRETQPYFTNASISKLITPEIPFAVILFDEIEKSSDTLWNLLLGILDKGTLTTGSNEVVDMTKTVIVMTSNIGSSEMAEAVGDEGIGFAVSTGKTGNLEEIAVNAARRKFMPEFLNRLDEIVTFNTLTPDDLNVIVDMEFAYLQQRIIKNSNVLFSLRVSPAARQQILKEGYDKRYNARNLKRTIEKHIGRPLEGLVSSYQILPKDTVIIDYHDGEWNVHAESETLEDAKAAAVLSGWVEVPTLRE